MAQNSTFKIKNTVGILNAAKFSRQQLIFISSVLVLFGLVVILLARAATALIVVEAETMTIPSGGYVVSDSAASGTKALRLDQNGTSTIQFTLPSAASGLTVRAKGLQCSGAPQMVVRVDGAQVQSNSVSSTSWADYSSTVTLPAGAHTLSIGFANDYSGQTGNKRNRKYCSRDLIVDKATFMGATDDSAITINDGTVGASTNQFEFVGSWVAGAESSSYGGDEHYSATAGSYYQVRFSGTQAKIFTTIDPRHGIAGISIDGGPETMIDTYAAARSYGVLVYTSPVLADSAHTLKVRVTGAKNPASSSAYIVADKVMINSSTTPPPPPPSVRIITPANGATVSGSIPVEATASTTSGSISKVEFYLDGGLKAVENAAPYCMAGDSGAAPCYNWDSRTVSDGTHTIAAYAYDSGGIKSLVSTVSVIVKNQVAPPATNTIGVYMGPAKVTEHNQFSAWLGNEAYYAVDFIDDSQSWENIANYSDWLLSPWGSWVKSKSGRRMVISMPMLNQSSAGQLSQGANGAFDSYFRTLSEEMVAYGLGNSVIRLGWEANGDWYPWKASTDPLAWKAYYRRIVGVMRSVPGQSFSFNLNYNLGNSGTAITFESMYPGNDVVDSIGVDAYDVKWQDSTSSPEIRWNNLLVQPMGLNEFKSFAASKGKPMSIPEWGLWQRGTQDGGYGDNPYYIDQMAKWIKANGTNVAFQSYFNHLSGWTGDHRLSSYPNSQAMYKTHFGPVVSGTSTSTDPVMGGTQ